jgi:hemin uptake protein HemP
MNKPPPKPAAAPAIASDAVRSVVALRQRLNSADLFRDAREVIIEHADVEYRLRLTGQGKLILTK